MRRLAALLMLFTLVSVTSLPLIPDQPVCANEAVLQMQAVDHAMAAEMPMHEHAMAHDYEAPMVGAMLDCRLECGCGCHVSIDGLPHVLAPHVFETASMPVYASVLRASDKVWPILQPAIIETQHPPPKPYPSDLV